MKPILLVVPSRADVIDRYGEVSRQLSICAPLLAEAAVLRSQMQKWYEDADPEAEYTVEGNVYVIQLGPRAKERTIRSMRRLYRSIGLAKFLQLCTFPLKVLDKLEIDTSGIVTEDRTGLRAIKPVLKTAVRKDDPVFAVAMAA